MPLLHLKALAITFLLCATCHAQTQLTVHSRNDATAQYAISIIEMALNKAQVPYSLNIQPNTQSAITLRRMLNEGKTDIIWATTSKALEEQFIPVRIPLYKGLMGYRTLLIQPEKQHLFDGITDLEGLKKVRLGQVHSWADTAILEGNGLNVIKVTKHESLFSKLKADSFDAAPRALHETFSEVKEHPTLAVESGLLLHYPMPMYLFVSQKNIELAHNLTYGLSKAVQDGTFDILFYRQPDVKKAVDEIAHTKRRLIELKNPGLPEKTPLDNNRLWLDFK